MEMSQRAFGPAQSVLIGPDRRARVDIPRPRDSSNAAKSHQELDLGDLPDVRRNFLLETDITRSEHAQHPLARRGEEAEAAVVAERHLGDELVAAAEEPDIAGGYGGATAKHLPLDDRLL